MIKTEGHELPPTQAPSDEKFSGSYKVPKVVYVLIAALFVSSSFGLDAGFIAAIAIWLAARRVRLGDLKHFLSLGPVAQTPETLDFANTFLRRTRIFRRIFLFVPFAIGGQFGVEPPYLAGGIGYVIGTGIEALTAKRIISDPNMRVAVLSQRAVGTYISRVPRIAMFVAALLAMITFSVTYFIVTRQLEVPRLGHQILPYGIYALASVLVVVLTELIAKSVAAKRQPSDDSELIALDDAARSATIHSLVRVGLTTAVLCIAGVCSGVSKHIFYSMHPSRLVLAPLEGYVGANPPVHALLELKTAMNWIGCSAVVVAVFAFFFLFRGNYWRVSRLIRR